MDSHVSSSSETQSAISPVLVLLAGFSFFCLRQACQDRIRCFSAPSLRNNIKDSLGQILGPARLHASLLCSVESGSNPFLSLCLCVWPAFPTQPRAHESMRHQHTIHTTPTHASLARSEQSIPPAEAPEHRRIQARVCVACFIKELNIDACDLRCCSKYGENPKILKIKEAPACGLCARCKAQIEWRKQYNKYKPLTAPATWFRFSLDLHIRADAHCAIHSARCHQKCVKLAYHTVCGPCAQKAGICSKCCQQHEQLEPWSATRCVCVYVKFSLNCSVPRVVPASEQAKQDDGETLILKSLRERERRIDFFPLVLIRMSLPCHHS
jgi:hypothetical protein